MFSRRSKILKFYSSPQFIFFYREPPTFVCLEAFDLNSLQWKWFLTATLLADDFATRTEKRNAYPIGLIIYAVKLGIILRLLEMRASGTSHMQIGCFLFIYSFILLTIMLVSWFCNCLHLTSGLSFLMFELMIIPAQVEIPPNDIL